MINKLVNSINWKPLKKNDNGIWGSLHLLLGAQPTVRVALSQHGWRKQTQACAGNRPNFCLFCSLAFQGLGPLSWACNVFFFIQGNSSYVWQKQDLSHSRSGDLKFQDVCQDFPQCCRQAVHRGHGHLRGLEDPLCCCQKASVSHYSGCSIKLLMTWQ